MLLVVCLLRSQFAQRLVGNVLSRPDLAVRVRIARAHHRAAVLEYLHVVDPGKLTECCGLFGPGVDHAGDIRHGHPREREGVVGVEAEDAAEAPLGLGDQQRRSVCRALGLLGHREAVRGSRCRRRRRLCRRDCAARRNGRCRDRDSRRGRTRCRARRRASWSRPARAAGCAAARPGSTGGAEGCSGDAG